MALSSTLMSSMIGALKWLTGRRRTMALLVLLNVSFLSFLYYGLTSYSADDAVITDPNRHWVERRIPNKYVLHKETTRSRAKGFLDNQLNNIWPLRHDEDKMNGELIIKGRNEELIRNNGLTLDNDINFYSDVGPCGNITRPDPSKLAHQRFHRVSEDLKETFVFSAFFDPRLSKKPAVRIIGLSKGDWPVKYCQVWYADDDVARVYTAQYQIVPETHDRKYAPSMHVCQLKYTKAPYAVSLVNNKCDKPTHALRVHAHKPRARPTYDFTVCVSPLNFNLDNEYQLIEMVEVNRMFGADRIVFYNHTSGPKVTKVLDYYSHQGVVEVIQWKIPVKVDTWPRDPDVDPEIHYFGQLVSLHDCLYRYMFTSRFIVFTDLDEFIVPKKTDGWDALIKTARCPPATSSYMFLNTFFRMDWSDDPVTASNDVISKLRLTTLLKLRREDTIWPAYSRSKIMVRPKLVVQLGVHFAYEYINSDLAIECEVSAGDALLHHYRLWEDDGMTLAADDRRMVNFTDQIVSRSAGVHDAIGHPP